MGVELSARSRGRTRGSGGKAESFEAIVHLKEGPKLVKTLILSKCAVMIHWSQSWGPKVHDAPNLLIEGLCPLAPPLMGGGANWNSGGCCKSFSGALYPNFFALPLFYRLFHPWCWVVFWKVGRQIIAVCVTSLQIIFWVFVTVHIVPVQEINWCLMRLHLFTLLSRKEVQCWVLSATAFVATVEGRSAKNTMQRN